MFLDNLLVPAFRQVVCPETSVTNYQSTLRKIPEERIPFAHRRFRPV